MTWTRQSDIKLVVQKWWDRGDLLQSADFNKESFPRKVSLKGPTSAEMSTRFTEVRTWISELRDLPHVRLVMREFNHRSLGRNSIPSELWIDSVDDALAVLNKRREASRFNSMLIFTQAHEPKLVCWLTSNSLRALDFHDQWKSLLLVLAWMKANPRPNIYLRQVDLENIHTKFIEAHRAILAELADEVLPIETVERTASGIGQFARRYGFKDKPDIIRFRMLDPELTLVANSESEDMSLDIETFIKLDPAVDTIFITENEINFLAFPQVPNSMILFGGGYRFDHFARVHWLLHHRVFYWGDIDTHGFAILNSLRNYLPLVASLLMDEETLLSHRPMWGEELTPTVSESLRFLSNAEADLFQKLKAHHWQPNVRLEQERISWQFACQRIQSAASPFNNRQLQSPTRESSTEELCSPNRDAQLQAVPILTSHDIKMLLRPVECDLRLYLAEHEPPDERLDPFEQVMKVLFQRHKANHLSSITVATNREILPDAARKARTLNDISAQEPIVLEPLLAVHTSIGGHPVELIAEPDVLLLSKEGYIVRTVKLARNISDHSNRYIILELQLASLIFKLITGIKPVRLEVFNGAGTIVEIPDDGGASILRLLSQISSIKNLRQEPYSPVGWAKCNGCDYRQRCWSKAENLNDVALLMGVDQELAKALHRENCDTIEALFQNYDYSKLSNLQRNFGGKSQKVGKKASQILSAARSYLDNSEICLAQPEIRLFANYVMLDLEGMPPHLDESEKIYLWGMQVFGEVPGEYMPAVSGFEVDGDKEGWSSFLLNASNIFSRLGDIPFVHWHHYERVKLELYINRFGDKDGIAGRVLKNLIDLLPIVRDSFALPIPSYSLKQMEKVAGYIRSQEEYGGTWSMARYIEACELGDSAKRQELMDAVCLYNREDLEATWAVLRWLLSKMQQ